MIAQTIIDKLKGDVGEWAETLTDESIISVANKRGFDLEQDQSEVELKAKELAFADFCWIIANGTINEGQTRVQRGNRSETRAGKTLNETTRRRLIDNAWAIYDKYDELPWLTIPTLVHGRFMA